ncbi:MAG: hypothetical protein JXI43_13440 [Tissierellales bacterium]|nr:hypothetical protein [Tissierellales bacterium]
MKKESHEFKTTITIIGYMLLVILGLLLGLLAIGSFEFEKLRQLLAAGVAASMMATGIAGIISYWIIAPQSAKHLDDVIKEAVGFPARILPERRYISERYAEFTKAAKNIDVLSMSLSAFCDNYPTEDLIKWIKYDEKNFRLLVLSPKSPIIEIRNMQENTDIRKKILDSFKKIKEIHDRAESDYRNNKKWNGSLEVRIYDNIPYLAYFRADAKIIVGLYYSHIRGTQSETILLQRGDDLMFKKLEGHFKKLWDGDKESFEDRLICTISNSKPNTFYAEGLVKDLVKHIKNVRYKIESK